MTLAKRILVTGGAGFIGSHVVDRLVALGHRVTILDDLSTGRQEHVNSGARFYAVDITDKEAVQKVFARERPQVVNHHAAQISVARSIREPEEDARINLLGSLNLFEQCRQHGVEKVVFASTGGALYGEPTYLPCDENHPVRPLAPYGAAKYAVEGYLSVYHQTHGIPFTVLRYGNVYGPRQDPYGEAGVVAIFAQAMLEGKQPLINGDGEQERDFVYVADVVEANVAALENGDGGVYNIGTGVGTSVNRIAQPLQNIINYKGTVAHGPPRGGEVFKIYLDTSRARKELGWMPEVPLEEGLLRTVNYFKDRK